MRIYHTGVVWHCLCAITRLGVVDRLADGPLPADLLAARSGVQPEPLRRVLRLLGDYGMVRFSEKNVELTKLGRLLSKGHPSSIWAIFAGVGLSDMAHVLEESLRTGEVAAERVLGAPYWEYLAAHEDEQAMFDECMWTRTSWLAESCVATLDWPSSGTVVDVGGGVGTMMSAVLRAGPGLKGILIDQEQVLARARVLLADELAAGRCELRSAELFSPAPRGDIYLLSYILHDWSDSDAVRILDAVGQDAPESYVSVDRASAYRPAGSVHLRCRENPAWSSSAWTPPRRNLAELAVQIRSPAANSTDKSISDRRTAWSIRDCSHIDRHWTGSSAIPISADEAFNGYVAAQVVFALDRLGLLEELLEHGRVDVGEAAVRVGADEVMLGELLRAAQTCGYVVLTAGVALITPAGRDMAFMRGYFTWAVGGYSDLFSNIAGIISGDRRFNSDIFRDEAMVALGSGQNDQAFMAKTVDEVVGRLEFTTIADLGSGISARVCRVAGARDGARGVGLDISDH